MDKRMKLVAIESDICEDIIEIAKKDTRLIGQSPVIYKEINRALRDWLLLRRGVK